jgi:hypothetical protein
MMKNGMIGAAVVSMCFAGAAFATPQFTTVNPPPSGEKGHGYIFGQIYGGAFSKASNNRDYSNGLLLMQRLADSGGSGPTSLTTPTSGLSNDNQWIGPAATLITAKAKYAAHNSTFGYFDDTKPTPTFVSIFNTSSFDNPAVIALPAEFRWALKNNTTGKTWTSNPANNVENGRQLDQLVSYETIGLAPGVREWTLFWEDLSPKDCSDYDYNDSVITIRTYTQIPTPGAAALFGAGAVLLRRRKR